MKPWTSPPRVEEGRIVLSHRRVGPRRDLVTWFGEMILEALARRASTEIASSWK